MKTTGFDNLINRLRDCAADLPDHRTGKNIGYSMADIALSAFFLEGQRNMQTRRDSNNAQTLFGIEDIPCDSHICNMLDPLEPECLFDMFDEMYRVSKQCGLLEAMRQATFDNSQMMALDGAHCFSSQSDNIHCPNCSHKTHANGATTHFHAATVSTRGAA